MIRGRIARLVCAASVAGVCFGAPLVAGAFTEPRTYFGDPREGGGGGRWFTGSLAEGHGCSVCHTGPGPEALELTGLPEDGYVPGESYDLRVAWPEFAARADALREQGEGPPAMGLVAELVAESGKGAGVIEIASAESAMPDELCVLPEGAPAAQLFGERAGEPTVEEGTHCVAEALSARCLVAVLSCGARELRVRWTAPKEEQGAIWFAAGFVATEHAEGDAEGDAVTELSVAMLPAGSGSQTHESELHPGCSVVHRRPASLSARLAWLAIACLGLLHTRMRLRRRSLQRSHRKAEGREAIPKPSSPSAFLFHSPGSAAATVRCNLTTAMRATTRRSS